MSKQYKCRPSEILSIEDEYTAFCFDEACAEIWAHLMNKETAIYLEDRKENKEVKHYHSFHDFYKTL